MKMLKILLLPMILLSMVMVSCNDDNIDDTGVVITDPTTIDREQNPLVARAVSSVDGLVLDCITITFPFDLQADDQTTFTVNSLEDLDLLDDTMFVFVDFVFPLDVILADGTSTAVPDNEELFNLFASCLPTGDWMSGSFPAYNINDGNSCYELSFPLSLTTEDGVVIVVDTEEAFNTALAAQPLFFVFPLDLVDDAGVTISVASVDDMFDALFSCSGWTDDTTYVSWENDFEYIGCYLIEYPLSIVLGNGTTVSVNNQVELYDYMLTGQMVGFAFPMTLTSQDGMSFVVNSEAELNTALEDCQFTPGIDTIADLAFLYFGTQAITFDSTSCWSIVFPVDVNDNNGNLITLDDQAQIEALITNANTFYDVQLPVSVILTQTGATITATTIMEYTLLLENCNG